MTPQDTKKESSSYFKSLHGTNEKTIDQNTSIRLQDTLHTAAKDLESPAHTVYRILNYYVEIAAVKTAIDLGVFKLIAGNPNPCSVDELASVTKTDPLFLARLLRCLAANHFVTESCQDHFASNGTTLGLTDPRIESSLKYMFNLAGPATLALPEYLKEVKYKNEPGSQLAWHKGVNTDLDFFPWMQQHPEPLSWFGDLMSMPRQGDWLDVVPFSNMDSEEVVFVDVGGSIGHNCAHLLEKHPELQNKVILQDRPEVIAIAKPIEGLKAMAHDFFTTQIVQGARYYYFRSIFHDWSDDQVVDILQKIIPAMGPNSQILIDEMVIPKTRTHWWPAWMDLQMYVLLGAKERTVDQWMEILDRAGLKLADIKEYNPVVQIAVIIADSK